MLLYGAPLQALESALPNVEVDASDLLLEVDTVLKSAGLDLQTARQTASDRAASLVQQPWADALAMMLTAYSFGVTQESGSPPSPPSDARSSKDYDLDSLAKGFSEKNAVDAIPLLPGWNQISLPEVPGTPIPGDSDPATVLAAIGGSYTKVYAYDGCDAADPWKVYDPADPAGSDLTVIGVEQGLIIDATAAVSLPSDGTLPDSTTFQLCTGWNLIGFPSAQPRHVRSALAPIIDKVVRVFGFDPFDVGDPWAFFEKDAPAWASDLDTLEPGQGYWILVTEDVQFEIKNVGEAPDIAFISPLDLDVVTAPTKIHGRVASDLLESWQLRYRGVGEPDWVDLASGNYPTSGKLGDFDPTLLLNGMYEIELNATDLQGLQVTDSIAVVVEGNMKIGHFTLSFVDLAIPLSGLDIEVVRTYDSRQRHLQGDFAGNDFGPGWSLDIRQGSYRNNRPPGDGWVIHDTQGPWGLPCSPDAVQPTKSHLTTIRLSDQEVYRFRLVVEDPGTIIGGCIGRADFEFIDGPIPGATLEILGNTSVLYQNNSFELRDPNTFALYEPEDVKLTTRDGRIFHLDLNDGVTHLEDLNGNTLDITPEGITHSSGRGVQFERDAEGRIERIVDPMGNANVYAYGETGDLVTFIDRVGAETQFVYAEGHYLENIVNALGVRAVRTEYDDDGRVARMIDAADKITSFKHDLGARREVLTDRLGHVRILEYDVRGNLIREVDALGHETLRTFDARDNLLTETNPLGQTLTYGYSPAFDVQSIRDPLGNTLAMSHDDRGRPLTLTEALGHITTNTYSASGLLTRTRDPLGNETTFGYDANGNLASITDALGQVTHFTFDGFGRLIQQTNALGHSVALEYDANGNRTVERRTRTLPDGTTQQVVTSIQYDALDRPIQATLPDGSVHPSEYDALGRMVRQVDGLGRSTAYTYDSRGLLEAIQHADGTTTRSVYDDAQRLTTSIDALGRTTSYAYDALGRRIQTTFPGPDQATESMAYDAAGRMTSVTDARGFNTSFLYDGAGRQIQRTDALGHTVQMAYDANNQLRAVTDPLGNTTEWTYDPLGRVQSVLAPDDSTSQTIFDALGRVTAQIDEAGRRTGFTYDAVGRLVGVTDALDQQTSYGYDEQGNLVRQTDANGQITRFEHDTLGRQTARVLADGARETFTYDTAGQRLAHTDFNGVTRTFSYDALGRLLQRNYPDGTREAFSRTVTGRRATATDRRGGVTTYAYDARDRLISKTAPDGSQLTLAYDAVGNRLAQTVTLDAESASTHYQYDALNRLQTVTDPRGGPYSFHYDERGLPQQLSYPNGLVTTWNHDTRSRLTQLETRDAADSVIQSFGYQLSPTGQRLQVTEHNGTRRAYTYDALNRLTEESVHDGADGWISTEQFSYDPVGNRLQSTQLTPDNTTSTAYAYDVRNRLVHVDGQPVTWDAAGRQLSWPGGDGTPGANYNWDVDDRLLAADLADGTAVQTTYDADGQRIQTAVHEGSETTTIGHLVDDTGWLSHEVAEVSGGQLGTVYVRAGDRLLGSIHGDPEQDRFYHLDGLGSVRALTDPSGNVQGTLDYTAFGRRLPGSDLSQPYGFTGEPWSIAGLSYHRARWMAPGQGRFLSQDPFRGWLGSPASQHGYGYAHQDPVNLTDPSGLVVSTGRLLSVSAAVGILTTIVSPPLANMLGYQMTTLDAVEAGGWAFLFTAISLAAPPAGLAIALYGWHKSLQLYYEIWSRPSATPAQKAVATGILALSAMGVAFAGSQTIAASPGISNTNPGPAVAAAHAKATPVRLGNSQALRPYYPANNGFLGETTTTTLRPGQLIDRFGGSDYSRFFSPVGTPEAARALPPGTAGQPLRTFQVLKPLEVESGAVTPAFGELGHGIQYRMPVTLKVLIERGILREIESLEATR